EILNNSRADSKSPIDRSNEKESSAFAFWKSLFGKEEALEIAPIRKEIGKIPEFRKIILRALTTNSCEFLKAGHRGRIEVGLDANFNLYKKNPLAMEDRLLFPDSVYQRGNLVSGKPIK
ncbi:MAG: hypothetical protein GW761_10170, partial [Leptospira sp.]|nr:hypothetical protein [Leptospira sp.]